MPTGVRPSVRSPAAPGDSTRADSRARIVKRVLPTFTSAVIAAAYVIIAPRSEDLAAHLLRAKLFSVEGWFGIWNNWWYAGHNIPGYSVLFPPFAAALIDRLPPSADTRSAMPRIPKDFGFSRSDAAMPCPLSSISNCTSHLLRIKRTSTRVAWACLPILVSAS